MFSKQPGNTELDKCMNFITRMGVGFDRYDVKTISGDDITLIVTAKSSFEVFNNLGEKVAECDDEVGHRITNVSDMQDDLSDLGFEI